MDEVALARVVLDLEVEHGALDEELGALAPGAWDAPTPARGWTVRHQVAHLAMGEELAATAIADPVAFRAEVAALVADLTAVAARTGREAAGSPPDVLRARWRQAAAATVEALRAHDPDARINWIAGPMRPETFAGARLMETFAHGHDVVAAQGRRPPASGRLVHVADLGVRTRGVSFRARGLHVPDPPRVELDGPGGARWEWGSPGADESVAGAVLEFCEIVTQRRHVDDTSVRADGDGARRWLEIAQAFAGPPTRGPSPAG